MSGWRGSASAILLASIALLALPPAADAKSGFKQQVAPLEDGRLFDLSVADYRGDGLQGMFSTNHSFLSGMSRYEGDGWTGEDLFQMGLSQSPQYPGFEDLLNPPTVDRPGLFIWADARFTNNAGEVTSDSFLHVAARDLGDIPLLEENARLTITLLSPDVRVTASDGVTATVTKDDTVDPPRSVVELEIEEQGSVDLVAKKLALPPIEVDIAQAPLRRSTYVGARKIRARSPSFTLSLRDRHGIAWGDVNGDGIDDAYITAGGVGGQINGEFRGVVEDEMMLSGSGPKLVNSIAGSGINKKACRGRMAALVDYDSDLDLDVFSSCLDAGPKLWRQDGERFRGVSAILRRAGAEGTAYRWADVHRRRGPELLVAGRGALRIYRFTGTRFVRTQRVALRNKSDQVASIALADFDRDRDPDLFVASKGRNTLLINKGNGRFRPKPPGSIGLPERSIFATWVDVDNNGSQDLHTLPDGLYEARKVGRRYARVGEVRIARKVRWGVGAWWDFDGDGARDVAYAGRVSSGPRVRARFLRNRQPTGNWLHIDVTGPGGSAGSLGAKVVVGRGKSRQAAWVGQSESSRFSTANYRLFFGLGKQKVVKRIKVTWPDGTKRVLGPQRTNRLLTIDRSDP